MVREQKRRGADPAISTKPALNPLNPMSTSVAGAG
jgi:hypothetical protein